MMRNWRRPAHLERWVEAALMAAAVLLCAWAAWTWTSRSLHDAQVDAVLTGRDESETDRTGPPPRVAEALKQVNERNVFSPPPPEGFQGQVVGVLGDQAIFSNRQTAGVGDTAMGAKVLAIGPDWVKIEFEGQERQLQVFSGRGGGSAGGGGRQRPGSPGPGSPGPGSAGPSGPGRGFTVPGGPGGGAFGGTGGAGGGPRGGRSMPGGMGRELTPEQMERIEQMRERFMSRRGQRSAGQTDPAQSGTSDETGDNSSGSDE